MKMLHDRTDRHWLATRKSLRSEDTGGSSNAMMSLPVQCDIVGFTGISEVVPISTGN